MLFLPAAVHRPVHARMTVALQAMEPSVQTVYVDRTITT